MMPVRDVWRAKKTSMLLSFVKNLVGRHGRNPGNAQSASGAIRLHIGGQVAHSAWKILDVRSGPHVDYVGSCTDLSAFGDGSIAEIYASHVIEHLGYQSQLAAALREFNRVLAPDGLLRTSVPDLATLCALFLDPALDAKERFHVMRMMFGGQMDNADFHCVGLDEEFLASYLLRAGFIDIVRVDNFRLFDDASSLVFKGKPISLNLRSRKPPSCAS